MKLRVSTKATLAVARKLIENVIKGNPAFKPYKGVHGKASWFLIEGDPHTGVANQGKDVTIWADIDRAHVVTDDSLVADRIAAVNRERPGLINSAPKEFDLIVWDSIGEICSARAKATDLKVPSCKLSIKPGRFLVLPPSVSKELRIDFEGFKSDANQALFSAENFSYEAYKKERAQYESDKDAILDKVLTVWIGPFRGPRDRAIKDIETVYAKVKQDAGTLLIHFTIEYRIFTFKRAGWAVPGAPTTEQEDGFYYAVSLTYPNYREAKKAFKNILTRHASNPKVHCFAGTNWYTAGKNRATSATGEALTGAVEATILNTAHYNF